MSEQREFLRRLTECLAECGIPYMVTGSLSSSFHGQPRATNDIDLVIAPSPEQLDAFVRRFGDDYYLSPEAARRALHSRGMFNIIEIQTGWKADLIIQKARAFSQEEFRRRIPVELMGVHLAVATPEDVILSKLEWSGRGESERQYRDALGVALTQGEALDRAYLRRWGTELGVKKLVDRLLEEVDAARS